MNDTSLDGRCFCDNIHYRISPPFRNLCLCHCESCRRAAGAPFLAWGTVDRSAFHLLRGELSYHRSSPGVERGFCNRCGSSITYYNESRREDLDFTLATLVDPESLQPRIQIFTEDRLAWIDCRSDRPNTTPCLARLSRNRSQAARHREAEAMKSLETISWQEFEKVELRVGTIVAVEAFPEARKPAWKLSIDFGADLGMRKSSAQITTLYEEVDLIGRQVLAVVNFPPKQIGPMMSECLVTGFEREDGAIVLAKPDSPVPNGSRLV